jgi:hypothetical protein
MKIKIKVVDDLNLEVQLFQKIKIQMLVVAVVIDLKDLSRKLKTNLL